MDIKQSRIDFVAHGVKVAGVLNVPNFETKLPAIICTHPTSSCKEQTAGKYAYKLGICNFSV